MMYILLVSTLILMLLIIFVIIFNLDIKSKTDRDTLNANNDYRGVIGELQLYDRLKTLRFEKELFKNIRSGNAEIDIVMLTHKGLFVFEMKNRSSSIFGSDNGENWKQFLGRDTEHSFYNPISQNAGHIRALKYNLRCKNKIKMFSYIVFGYNCEQLDVQISDLAAKVLLIQDVSVELTSHYHSLKQCINEQEYNRLKLELSGYVQFPEELKQRYSVNG